MSFLSRWLGFTDHDEPHPDECALDARKAEIEAAIAEERGRLNNHVQSIQSGSRVLQNMAGAMRIHNLSHRIDRE